MKLLTPVLSITGSDNTGAAGIQADIKTITALGGNALTAVTTVTVQDSGGIQSILDLPRDMVVGQVKAIIDDHHPRAVKVGMVRDAETIRALKHEIIGCPQIVLVPGIVTSHGRRLLSDDAIDAWRRELIPEATLLLLRCNEAELLLGRTIHSDDDMLTAAEALTEMGARAVLLRGGHQVEGRLTALLYGAGRPQFFTSQNTEGWQRHGVGGALSSAIATRLALGDDMGTAIRLAHDYLHSQVVYAVEPNGQRHRPADLYNQYMTLIAAHYRTAHGVAYYADRLAITPRYLSQITSQVVGKTPKQVIDDYLMKESESLLGASRLTVSEVADRLGFSSLAMFSKFFASHEGCPPNEYRRKLGDL
ncbi:MAG: bifunctional hydroxymethylpyrimidine kinase/phosphomethylpyrimidine kinase [Prevotella sp.]|nr:bifunctional hydroxymethylpyrimidine kinase/phosphomethylpyrimidine kinase [Prevotella sp.]